MNFNQPNAADEEAKAQANIDNILGNAGSNMPPVQAAPIDTNKLFDFAGLDTNRNEDAGQFIFDAQPQPAAPQEPAQPTLANDGAAANSNNDALADFL